MKEHEKPWNPFTVDEIATQFSNAPFPWWIAGGYAIELALGKSIRQHSDIDILVLRSDHIQVRELLIDWDCWVADPPGVLRYWPSGDSLDNAIHDIWCRKTPSDHWRFQVMLDEFFDGNWSSRRDPSISSSIEDITWETDTGIRFLAPQIQLFYKAKNIRERDQIDFDAVIDAQIAFNRSWLKDAILRVYGSQHPWLERIQE